MRYADAIAAKPDARRIKAWLPLALVALSIVPVAAGIGRLNLVAAGKAPTPEEIRFLISPAPVVIHILAASIFSILGAFQFSSQLRGRSSWHRFAGWLLIPCGLTTALSALWMTLVYPSAAIDGAAVYLLRLVFGGAMVVSMVMAIAAIGRRDFRSHAAWMIRAYAIALGAGTQVLTHLPWFLLIGAPDVAARAWLMGAGWVINVVAAEWAIGRGNSSTHQAPKTVHVSAEDSLGDPPIEPNELQAP